MANAERQRRDARDPERRPRLRASARAGGRDRGRRPRRRPARSAVAPDHSPRAPPGTASSAAELPHAGLLPAMQCVRRGDVQREVEQFLYLPGRAARRQALAGVDRPVRRDGVYWMPVDARADRVGRLALDLRRGQADDGDQEGPRLASQRLVAGADVGDQPPRQPRRARVGARRRRSRCARAST